MKARYGATAEDYRRKIYYMRSGSRRRRLAWIIKSEIKVSKDSWLHQKIDREEARLMQLTM